MAAEGATLTARPINPGVCDICRQQLRRAVTGVRFYRCYNHCVCEYCDDEYPDQITNQCRTQCPICQLVPTRRRQILEESSICRADESQQNIVIVIKELGNCMDTASSLAKDLASYLSEMNLGNIFIVADNSNLLQQYLSNISHNVTILNCRGDDDEDIDRLREDVGKIGALIGFVPSTWEKTARIKIRCNPDRTVLIIHDSNASDMIKHLRGQDFALFSLGPEVYSSLNKHSWVSQLLHTELIPPLPDRYLADRVIKDVQNTDFRISFPMILRSDNLNDLVCHFGGDLVLNAIDRLRQDTSRTITLSVVIDRTLIQNPEEITEFIKEKTNIEPHLLLFTNEQNWIADIMANDLAICPSIEEFTYWLYRIMDQNITFLVAAKSGMGVLLKDIYPDVNVTVENNVEDWYRAMKKLLHDESEGFNYCIVKQNFIRRYDIGFYPVATFMFGELIVALRMNADGGADDRNLEVEERNKCDRQLEKFYHSLESVMNRYKPLQLCYKSMQNKCRTAGNAGIEPAALETEKSLIQLFRWFRVMGQTVVRVNAGSLVFHAIPHSAAAITKIKELRASGELKQMMIKYLNLPTGENMSIIVDLKVTEPAKKRRGVYDADKKVYMYY